MMDFYKLQYSKKNLNQIETGSCEYYFILSILNYFKNITKKMTETCKGFTQLKTINIFFFNKLCLRLFCRFLVRNPNCKFVVILIKLHQLIIYNILKFFKSATGLLKLLNNQFFLFVNRSYFIYSIF